MSAEENLSPKQFKWSKEHDAYQGITYHVHNKTKAKVFNNLTGKYKWEIKGGKYHGEIHSTLGEAKTRIEEPKDEWEEKFDAMTPEEKKDHIKTYLKENK
jgi:hypothetical protein